MGTYTGDDREPGPEMTDHLASLGALGFTCREAVLHIARELVRTADTYACDPACFMDRALP